MKTILLIMTALALTACGSGSDNKPKGQLPNAPVDIQDDVPPVDETGGTKPKVDFTINGKKPREYYNQFLYRYSGECPNNIWFHYLSTSTVWQVVLKKISEKTTLQANFDAALVDDNTFYFKYEEYESTAYDATGSNTKTTFKEEGYAQYTVTEDGRIILGKWGTGSALKFNDRHSVMFAFTNQERPLLVEKRTLLGMVAGNTGPLPTEQYHDVCK